MIIDVGVIEDRMDPEEMGRVRVRIIGLHTDSKELIPTSMLPWAMVMMPNTGPSMNGIGETPHLVEGSHVVIGWNDEFNQDPVVLGSIPGWPVVSGSKVDATKGFVDPLGKYPIFSGEPDYNRLGRGKHAETHNALAQRVATVSTKVPKATKPDINTVEPVEVETREYWDELTPKSGTYAQYPYNHVRESESGHVTEIDDSPDGERLMTFHKSGTFEEIHPTGSKVIKIVKDSYEITLGSKSIYIHGACDITCDGTMRHLVKGDYVLEVEGNYTQKIGKNRYTKVGYKEEGGNDSYEIKGHRSGNISKSETLWIGGGSTITTSEDHKHTINGDWDQTILGNTGIMNSKNFNITAMGNFGIYVTENGSLKVSGGLEFDITGNNTYTVHGTLAVDATGLLTIVSADNVEVTGAQIHLNK